MTDAARDATFFDDLYASDPDPWRFRTSAYEAAKYAATVAAIGDRRYRSGLEVGCSIGVLSREVAPLCDAFLGIDISERPLAEARTHCADLAHVRFARKAVPGDWPEGRFDLILLSEVLYFLSMEDIRATAERIGGCLLPGGRVLLVNWIGNPEPPQPGDLAADAFLKAAELAAELAVEKAERAEGYRLELLAKPS